ncbi:hypothetical protein [Ancylobacter rudongensis]|uniref:Uncharacterized protein n=1 Tax=Ancylobacter rudongensis TaxID=177413 RepID=A0A1G4UQQ2_9HYPH|nr:hypothetical protein [Ancylobacter rudongensis]SCW95960.1 hypothetical protein SAMN05660859_0159 [Ancylobacter rudongensis]
MTSEWKLGDRVAISPSSEWHADWRDWAGYVCELHMCPSGKIDVGVSNHYPPKHLGDITDGFEPVDLIAAPADEAAGAQAQEPRSTL